MAIFSGNSQNSFWYQALCSTDATRIAELERENKLLREALIKERERNRKLKDQLYEHQNNKWLNPDQFQHFQ